MLTLYLLVSFGNIDSLDPDLPGLGNYYVKLGMDSTDPQNHSEGRGCL